MRSLDRLEVDRLMASQMIGNKRWLSTTGFLVESNSLTTHGQESDGQGRITTMISNGCRFSNSRCSIKILHLWRHTRSPRRRCPSGRHRNRSPNISYVVARVETQWCRISRSTNNKSYCCCSCYLLLGLEKYQRKSRQREKEKGRKEKTMASISKKNNGLMERQSVW